MIIVNQLDTIESVEGAQSRYVSNTAGHNFEGISELHPNSSSLKKKLSSRDQLINR